MTDFNALLARAKEFVLDRIEPLLAGEPLRMILYGSSAVVWIVTHAAFYTGIVSSPGVSFDEALVAATAAVAFLTEVCRRFVYSPDTLNGIVYEVVRQVEEAHHLPPKPMTPLAGIPAPGDVARPN